MNDIFPNTLSSFVQPIKHPVSTRVFKEVYRRFKTLNASEILLKKNKIKFIPISGCNEKLLKLFLKVGKDSYFPRYYHPRDLKWNNVSDYLKKKYIFKVNNSYNRICFRYGNTYLTSSHFTFGLRYVNEGTNHIYQTTNAPILIYMLPKPSKKINLKKFDLAQKNSTFNVKDQFLYNVHLLEPNRVYKIPDLAYYLIVTTQSTLFSVNVIKSETLLPFSLCRNPQDSKNYCEKTSYKHIDFRQKLTTTNHERIGHHELMPISPDSSAEKMMESKDGITTHSKHVSPSSPYTDHVQIKQDDIGENLVGALSSTYAEAGPEAYGPQLDCKVTRFTPPEFIQWYKNLKDKTFRDPTDYFVPTAIEEDAMPLDLSCRHTEVYDTSLGLDFEFDFNEEFVDLSYYEVLDYLKKCMTNKGD